MATIEVVGMAEAAEIVGVSKSNFSAHRKQFSGEGQCPPPTALLKSGPVWAGADKKALEKWAKTFADIRVTRPTRKTAEAAPDKATKATKAPAKKAAAPKAEAAPKAKKAAATKAAAPKAPAKKAAAKKGLFGSKKTVAA